ncbi:MAG: pyrroline-5-carboxylate reductase [Sedimenticola thiotaurini]|uniref:Pyrroline-5-carboxylate reductase n=1 Tax=Sedimenticola thiotaurini TaxID=1543721 RepID=A0A558DC71_9GAMM|nr:MAG: pyrroline-5-carboxylate reductase [Sedimenticola thiotaurini]
MNSKSIAFIGSGNMATSLIGGLVADGYNPKQIIASDPDSEKRADLAARFGILTAEDNLAAIAQADVVVLAVKPQVLEQICLSLAQSIRQTQPLVISIAAGIRESDMQHWLGGNVALVRTMPNTPAMLQAGATVLHAGKGVSESQRDLAESILRAVGLTRWVNDEKLMDIATALSGSGPAYFFLVMEAMETAAIENGLTPETARLLTIQTALGAARMAIESSDGPATLRQKVTSPGGTTERALEILEQGDLRALFAKALAGARKRSEELSEILGKQ